MRRSILSTVALSVIFGCLTSASVLAQDGSSNSTLHTVLTRVDRGDQLRLHLSGAQERQECVFRGLTGDTILIRPGRMGTQLNSTIVDSLWVRDKSSSGSNGILVGGFIGGLILGSATAVVASAFGDGAGTGFLAGSIPGFAIGSGIAALIPRGPERWLLRYPVNQPPAQAADSNQGSKLGFGITPDLKTGVRVAASYTF